MRALDFIIETTEILDEVAMNPSRLKQEAAKTGAQAGMEFEMIVPNVQSEDEDSMDPEADYDSDESANSIRDIREFFNDGDYNSRRTLDDLVDQLTEGYHEWADEKRSEQWEEEGKDFLREYIENEGEFDDEAAMEEAYDELGLTEEQKEAANKAGRITKRSETEGNEAWNHWKEAHDLVEEKIDQFVEEEWDNRGRIYDNAREQWFDDADWPDESDWLESQGLYTMQDIESNYDVTWPHWFYPDSGGELSVDDVADEFSRMIGKPINASQRYHGARREAGHYVVEPDGSLEPDDSSDAGLEFVSPPMPIDEMLSDFNKVVVWAKDKGCYTNDSTGLHINVSVPDFSREKLDYVKLALLLGDEYVLQEFGREGNTYTKSALKQVKDNIRQRPEDAALLLNKMKSGLSDIASKSIHSGATSKYTSINTKDGYIEFRSPGGDWLDADIPKIENTLLRFVVALDAACDPQKYRKEYLTKLYKLLAPSKDGTDTIEYFTKYAAGELPKAALRSFVQQAQLERKVKAEKEGNKKYWWRVSRPGYGASVEVVATSKEEAIAKGKKEYPDWANAQDMEAKPVRRFEGSKDNWEVYNNRTGEVIGTFTSVDPDGTMDNYDLTGDDYRKWRLENGISNTDPRSMSRRPRFDKPRYELFNLDRNKRLDEPVPERVSNDEEALTFLDDYINHGPHGLQPYQAKNLIGIRRWGDSNSEPILAQPIRATSNPDDIPTGGGTQDYKVYRTADQQTMYTFQADSLEIARERARRWLEQQGLDRQGYGLARMNEPTPVVGSTSAIQQQRAIPGTFTGAWKVMADGREVHRFSGVGNAQSDANRVAIQWLRNNGYDQGTDVEVLPIMT